MRNLIFLVVFTVAIASGIYAWINYPFGNAPGEGAEAAVHSLVVELAAPVKTKLKKTGTGNPVGYNPKMVSFTVTLRFDNEDAMAKASGEIRQLRRAYSNTIGTYLSNRENADDADTAIRTRIAAATEKLLGTGVVTAFDVEGQFDELVKE